MPLELRVPSIGESITEVQIGDWLKKEGESVRKDENLVVVESEKATVEVPSPGDGVLSKIVVARGQTARVGDVIAHIEAGGSTATPAPTASPSEAASDARASSATPPEPTPAKGGPVVMPAAQRILSEAGIPPESVTGTGRGGRVTREDALRATTATPPAQGSPGTPGPSPAPASPAGAAAEPGGKAAESVEGQNVEVVPMSPLRRTVARRLVEARNTMAMLTTFNEIDMSAVAQLRKQFQENFTAKHGVKLGFMSFFVKAVIEALKEIPALNAEIRETSVVYHRTFDIGVAIGGGKGLVVPVLRGAERMSFAEIEKQIAELAGRAREGRLKPEELSGGTFTITNGGIYGSLLSTPIINPPQSGILGMHAIQDRAVVINGEIVARPMMYVALTYDHRIVDGREAVTFLKRVKEIIETPARMLIEA